jgi:hypothetical protein
MATATAQNYAEPSLAKQLLYSRYARGEITRKELADGIGQIRPAARKTPWPYWLVATLLTSVVAALVPPQARRND